MKTDKGSKKLTSFWIAPLLAGSSLATGYEATQRIMIVSNKLNDPTIELFQTSNMPPGKGIEILNQVQSNPEKGTKLARQAIKDFPKANTDQTKKMQAMLDALDISWSDSNMTYQNQSKRSSTQIKNQKFSASKKTRSFQQQDFDKLFKSLPAPQP